MPLPKCRFGRPTGWLAGKTLIELSLPQEGVLVLGIQRTDPHVYLGAPTGHTMILADDVLVLYGPIERIEELDKRRAGRKGDVAHREAIAEHQESVAEQKDLDQQIVDASN